MKLLRWRIGWRGRDEWDVAYGRVRCRRRSEGEVVQVQVPVHGVAGRTARDKVMGVLRVIQSGCVSFKLSSSELIHALGAEGLTKLLGEVLLPSLPECAGQGRWTTRGTFLSHWKGVCMCRGE